MSSQAQSQRAVMVGGDIRNSILVLGDHNVLEVALGDDAILRRVIDEGRVRMQRRGRPQTPPPPPFADRVDREAEVAAIATASGHVNVYGTSGIGKTYVLLAALPEDAVYVDAGPCTLDDVLQAVCEELFDIEPPLIIAPARRRHELRNVNAVVALDDVRLSPSDVQRLLTEAPRCRYLVSSRRRVLVHSSAVRVPGLHPDDALKLVGAELGHPLDATEGVGARCLAQMLGGHPLMLRQAARLAVDTGVSTADVAAALDAGGDPVGALSGRLQARLEPEDRELLLELAAASGAPVGTQHAVELVGDPHAPDRLDALEARHLVRSHSPRFSLVGALAKAPPVEAREALETRRQASAHALAAWAARSDTSVVLDEAPSLLAALRWAQNDGRHRIVVQLARALDRPLALGRRWGTWLDVLSAARQAAAALDDAATEAWTLHQLGTREYAVGSAKAAVELLERALQERESIGDRAGAAATRHNLEFIRGGGAPPGPDDPTDDGGPSRPLARALLVTLLAILVLGVGALVAIGSERSPDPAPADPAPPSAATPRHTGNGTGSRDRHGSKENSRSTHTSGQSDAEHKANPQSPTGEKDRAGRPAGTDPGPGDATDPGPGDSTDPGPGDSTDPGPGDSTDPGPGDTTDPGNTGDTGTTDGPTPAPDPGSNGQTSSPPATATPDDTQDYGALNTNPQGPIVK